MSALGQKQTSAHVRGISALPPKADIATAVLPSKQLRQLSNIRRDPAIACAASAPTPPAYIDLMVSQNDDANAKRLLRALVARGANSKEPMANAWITEIALEIGLQGDELLSAMAYAGTQNWLEDSNGRTTLTSAGEGAAE